AYVLQNGVIVHQGQASEMLKDDTLRKAYLGM
ncbi:MAG: ABC transporter ATP-binding protein, partial [Spirochaetaceae bacterium]